MGGYSLISLWGQGFEITISLDNCSFGRYNDASLTQKTEGTLIMDVSCQTSQYFGKTKIQIKIDFTDTPYCRYMSGFSVEICFVKC